jgi:putative FmdB family regulatory protein
MPVYEYVCKRCAHPFEELVLGGETPSCPECAGEELEKRFSTFTVGDESGPRARDAAPMAPPGACGTCGDPRGPGACALD